MDEKTREKINAFDTSPAMDKMARQKHCEELRAHYFQALQVADDYKRNGEEMLERQARKQAEALRRQLDEQCAGLADTQG